MDTLWQRYPQVSQLRSFGRSVGAVLLFLGTISWWRHGGHPLPVGLWVVGAMLMLLGWVLPRALTVVYQIWMAIAFLLGTVMTTLILGVAYAVAFTTVGLVLRLAGKDPLDITWPPRAAARSYWHRRQKPDDIERHLKPY